MVTHQVRIVAVIAFGSDISLGVPVSVHRAPIGETSARARPVRLGNARRSANWKKVASQISARDIEAEMPDGESDSLDVRVGPARIHFAAEHRGGDGPFLVADVTWPRLGLDMRLTERKWLDVGKGFDMQGAFGDRFVLTGREQRQTTAFATKALQKSLLGFREAGMDDEGAAVASPGSPHTTAGLLGFVSAVLELVRFALASARAVPVPRAFEGKFESYRVFAEKTSGTLTRGNLSIDLGRKGVAISIRHRFEGIEPVETSLSSQLPGPCKVDGPTLDKLGVERGFRPELIDGVLRVWMPLEKDPAELDGPIDAFATLVRIAAGDRAAMGPYR